MPISIADVNHNYKCEFSFSALVLLIWIFIYPLDIIFIQKSENKFLFGNC